jgi:hypothetical protein
MGDAWQVGEGDRIGGDQRPVGCTCGRGDLKVVGATLRWTGFHGDVVCRVSSFSL